MDLLKIYSFELCGDFASFRKPDTNSVYLSYNNPPHPALLGFLGAIVGYTGYLPKRKKDNNALPIFYKNLSDIWLSFYPIYGAHAVFQKHMITYNNYHGYGSNDGCFQITEQILISPCWRIFLFDENDKHQDLINRLRDNLTVFTPYLGKNEFRAEIRDFKEFSEVTEISEEAKTKKAMTFDSVVLLKKQEEHPIKKNLSKGMSFADLDISSSHVSDDGYSIFENYPYALDQSLHYKLCLSVFTNWEIDPSILRNGSRIFKIRDKDEGQQKERVIQMFNGGLE